MIVKFNFHNGIQFGFKFYKALMFYRNRSTDSCPKTCDTLNFTYTAHLKSSILEEGNTIL